MNSTENVFKDFSFRADAGSIFDPAGDDVGGYRTFWNSTNVSWKRVQTNDLWAQKPRPADIRQGSLGDCWYLSTLAALAEWPDRIQNIVSRKNEGRGIYEFQFWGKGNTTLKVVIDDAVPFQYTNYTLFTGYGTNNTIWPMLYEKAAAKFWGTYERMTGGTFTQGYYPLTGRPSITPTTVYFSDILTADQNNDVMWTACLGGSYAEKNNIVSGHAYTLIGARNYKDSSNTTWQLVNLRNPWGMKEYNGTWSDHDNVRMTTKVKYELEGAAGTNDKNDGSFWMPFANFQQAF